MAAALPLQDDEHINWRTSIPFILLQFVPLLAFFTGVTWRAVVLCVVLYVVRMFFITAGYHRYFAHRSYRANRGVQLILAIGGSSAAQKGPLWWAGHHRNHHRFSDTERDLHSPLKGFWQSHVGWILCDRYGKSDHESISDFARYPELRFIDRHDWMAPWALGAACTLIAGWSGLVIGFFLSTVLLWHGTFTVNSLAHLIGRRRYATVDTSRNSLAIALITGGEGWHNNHHHFPASARQGFFWWEIDMTYYVLRVLSALHIVHDLRAPSATVKAGPRVRNGSFDVGMFRAYWAKASAAVANSRAQVGESVSALEAKLHAERKALEENVSSSLQAADAYARLARQRHRQTTTP